MLSPRFVVAGIQRLRLAVGLSCALMCWLSLSACTTTGLVLSAAGVATDTSIPWAIAKHVHRQMTEGDPVPCVQLNSVQRALTERCGEFKPGSIKAAEVEFAGFGVCPLSVAAREPQFWPVMTELLNKGARVAACPQSPLVDLAQAQVQVTQAQTQSQSQAQACPDFESASPASLRTLTVLAQSDGRAVHHDVLRLLSCPSARRVGLDRLIDRWMAQGQLPVAGLSFSPLSGLHPDHLNSPLAMALQAQGHTVDAALLAQDGKLPAGFEAALRASHWAALDWWLARRPALARSVPPAKGTQLPWLPLARVLTPQFLEAPGSQAEMVKFLMARGASPSQLLPFDNSKTVQAFAEQLKSPVAPEMAKAALAQILASGAPTTDAPTAGAPTSAALTVFAKSAQP